MDLIKIAEEAFATKKELPSFKRVLKMKVRTEDFKRSGAMKILRNQV